jgi:hypothetical protein
MTVKLDTVADLELAVQDLTIQNDALVDEQGVWEHRLELYEFFFDAVELTDAHIRRLNLADLMALRDWIKANL